MRTTTIIKPSLRSFLDLDLDCRVCALCHTFSSRRKASRSMALFQCTNISLRCLISRRAQFLVRETGTSTEKAANSERSGSVLQQGAMGPMRIGKI